MIVPYKSLCRLCCSATGSSKTSFSIFDTKLKIQEQIHDCFSIQVSENDGLPESVCEQCFKTLSAFTRFRMCVEKNDHALKTLTKNKNLMWVEIAKVSSGVSLKAISPKPSTVPIPNVAPESNSTTSLQDDEGEMGSFEMMPSPEPLEETTQEEPLLSPKDEETLYTEPQPKLVITRVLQKCFSFENPQSDPAEAEEMQQLGLQKCQFCQMVFLRNEMPMHMYKVHRKGLFCGPRPQRSENLTSPGKSAGYTEPPKLPRKSAAKPKVSAQVMVSDPLRQQKLPLNQNPAPTRRKQFTCDFCKKIFRQKNTLTEHIRTHIQEKPFSCEECLQTFTNRGSYMRHKRRHAGSWTHICEICNKGFVDKTAYAYHFKSLHSKEKPFACNNCDKTYYKNQDLVFHIKSVHGEEQPVQCEVCKKMFKNAKCLLHHSSTHIPVDKRRKYTCSLCPASFISTSGLKKHTLSHTGEKPYQCTLCPCKLKTRRGLEVHMINHSGVKSFVCEICGNAFTLENTLKVHMRRHTGERPFACKECGKSFIQNCSLTYHRRTCKQVIQCKNELPEIVK